MDADRGQSSPRGILFLSGGTVRAAADAERPGRTLRGHGLPWRSSAKHASFGVLSARNAHARSRKRCLSESAARQRDSVQVNARAGLFAFTRRTTCVAMYNSTASGLSSDEYQVVLEKEEVQVQKRPSSRWEDLIPTGLTKYILRPETVESLYVMYAKTRNPVFREWGWQIWSTIKKRCKGRYGFADLRNVDNANSELDDRGETFFYSETMKYLYLLFSEEGPSYLDDYIFNTEAHLIQKQTRSL